VSEWLRTPMTVSYAQVLGAGLTLLVLFWMVGTLSLWLYEMGRQVKIRRAIEHHQAARIDGMQDERQLLRKELELCKRALGRPLRPPRHD